jgi:hypothetical protein
LEVHDLQDADICSPLECNQTQSGMVARNGCESLLLLLQEMGVDRDSLDAYMHDQNGTGLYQWWKGYDTQAVAAPRAAPRIAQRL